MNRIGPQMQAALHIVANHPGCSKKYVAERISPLRRFRGIAGASGNWALGYNPVNRAIKAGLVKCFALGNRYALYDAAEVPDDWHPGYTADEAEAAENARQAWLDALLTADREREHKDRGETSEPVEVTHVTEYGETRELSVPIRVF